MRLKLVRWIPQYDFRKLSHLDGSLSALVRGYKLKNDEAIVVTSMGWHRLRIIARLADKAVMIIPETQKTTLMQLAEWVQLALRDGIVMLKDFRAMTQKAA